MPKVDFSRFPKLKIDPSNVFGSWSSFIKQFEIELRNKVGAACTKVKKESVDNEEVEVFDEELKCLGIFGAIGEEGQRVIESKVYDIVKKALNILHCHYGCKESIYVKTKNFVCIQQNAGVEQNLRL